MPIYHLSVKTISRSDVRSATAAAAYRAGVLITDERTGEIHDYTRKGGVESAELVLPAGAPEWASNRSALWNAVEQAETRKNSRVAREFEIALPDELSAGERQRLARDFAQQIVDRHGCAADVAIHAPGKGGDNRNHHAHILLSTRRLGSEGFAEKTRELDDQKTGPQIVTQWRERFASLQNERLRENGITASVDHRTLQDQGIDREPTQHLGPSATGYERRTGLSSAKRMQHESEALERLERAKALGELELEANGSVLDLSGEMRVARAALREEMAKEAAAWAAEREKARAAEARVAAAVAEVARRVDALERLKLDAKGADHIFALIALRALMFADDNSERVDWRAVERSTVAEAVGEYGITREEALQAITDRSPLRADPASHAEIREYVSREAPGLEAQYRRDQGLDHEDPPNDNDNDFSP